MRSVVLLMILSLGIAGCGPSPSQTVGADGKPLPRLYRISAMNASNVQFRMLDSVNALRQAAGVPAVEMDSRLNAAAATHSRDMSIQNRPWHFGSDGSSPIDRVRRVGYEGGLRGETISETYESELETLAAWMEEDATRTVILNSDADQMGFAWFQESNGKLWWTLVMGSSPQGRVSG